MIGHFLQLSKRTKYLVLAALLLASGGLLTACGGGGGGGADGGGTGATAGSVRSLGQITAKGSVVVNGVTFNTDNAAVVMDGQQVADDSGLRVGMVVEVEGTINDDNPTVGTATTVRFDDTIQGAAAGQNPADGSFTVMGKQVFTDDGTKIDDSNGEARTFSAIGGQVEVSGQVDDQGRIVATHIELKPAGAESEITGLVESTAPLTVAGIPVISDGSTALAVGDLVEVKGSFDGTSLTATSIELNPGLGDDDNLHIEGFVLSGNADAFTLRGHHLGQQVDVATSSTTVFEGGDRTDLIVGTKVEVDGALTAGAVAATKVQFRENVRIEMVAGAPDVDFDTIELQNLSAVTVRKNALTRAEDNSSAPAIGTGDSIEIRGRLAADGTVIATRMRIDDPPGSNADRVILRGPATVGSGGSLSLLGVAVDTSAVGIEFRPNDDSGNDTQTMSRDDFLAQVQTGTVIKVRGILTADNQLAADEMELED